MQTTAKIHKGTLTLKTDDGYVLEAPVEGFSVDVRDDYSTVETDWLLDSSSFYKGAQIVEFNATLAYGEAYTIRDLGVDVVKTLAVKGNIEDMDAYEASDWRSALGVPATAESRYKHKKGETVFTWTERVVIDSGDSHD